MKLYGDLNVINSRIFEDTIELKGLQTSTDDSGLIEHQQDDHEFAFTEDDEKFNIYDGKHWTKFQEEDITHIYDYELPFTMKYLTEEDSGKLFSNEDAINNIFFVLPMNVKAGVFYNFLKKFPVNLYIAVHPDSTTDNINNQYFIKSIKTRENASLTLYHLGFGKWVITKSFGQILLEGRKDYLNWVGDRAVFAGGSDAVVHNIVDHITISTLGNAKDFGDMTVASNYTSDGSSNGYSARAVMCRGYQQTYCETFCITIPGINADIGGIVHLSGYWGHAMSSNGMLSKGCAGPGASNDFSRWFLFHNPAATATNIAYNGGNQRAVTGGVSNGILNRVLFVSGLNNGSYMGYLNLSSPAAAQTFGYLTSWVNDTWLGAACSNGVNNRALISMYCVVDYITISTPSNSTFFGNLTGTRWWTRATSNGVNNRAIINGGYSPSLWQNNIDYMTISTLGDAVDFGDMTYPRWLHGAVSDA